MLKALVTQGFVIFLMCTCLSVQANFIDNGDFQESNPYTGWEDNPIFVERDDTNVYARVKMSQAGQEGYSGKLVLGTTPYLRAGQLYVLRMKTRSVSHYASRATYARSEEISDGNEFTVNVYGVGNDEWSSVFAAVRPTRDGIFQPVIMFYTEDDRPVYVDDISFSEEQIAPETVVINAPGYMKAADMTLPFRAVVLNQEGQPLEEEQIGYESSHHSITVENQRIGIKENTPRGAHYVRAYIKDNINIYGEHWFVVGDQRVFDGGFEETMPGQIWGTAAPSSFGMVSRYGNISAVSGMRMGRLKLNGAYSMIRNDSYSAYDPNKFYVVEMNARKQMTDVPTLVTLFLDNPDGEDFFDNDILGQFYINEKWERVSRVFMPMSWAQGRLIVAVSTPSQFDEQVVVFDDISIKEAWIAADNVYVSGVAEVNRALFGWYSIASNFIPADISGYRWLVSDMEKGVFTPIAGSDSRVLEITEDLDGKYVKFEVTPIGLLGGIRGASVASTPVLIGKHSHSTDKSGIRVPERYAEFNPFSDTGTHWARDDISVMSQAGIVIGRDAGLFFPDETITRAEFCAFIVRAFSMVPGAYDNEYEDVQRDDWYAGAVSAITEMGIADGVEPGRFEPNRSLTRQEMAALTMRAFYYAGSKPVFFDTFSFVDESDISEWAIGYVKEGLCAGIVRGDVQGRFMPHLSATRAEAMSMIRRMLERIN